LDPRIWNSQDALNANVPAAGGRFSAAGLASFYRDLENLLGKDFLDEVSTSDTAKTTSTSIAGVQGVTRLTNDANTDDVTHTKMSMGYQLIRTDRDSEDFFSGTGHAGVGGSVGFVHRPTGMSMAIMVNKADEGQDVTLRILRVIADHYQI
jgi:CubicO group peptidase (beta-lactamase class C family)